MKLLSIVTICSAIVAFAASPAAAKSKPQPSSLQLQQTQSKDFEASKAIVFSAVMTVLQDAGYRIGSADKDTGLITGTASTNSNVTWMPFVGFGKSKKTPVVSAFVEDTTPNITRVRLNFVMTKYTANQYGNDSGEEPILDATVYQTAFEKIDQAIFIRKAMISAPAPIAPIDETPQSILSAPAAQPPSTSEVSPAPAAVTPPAG
jgi:hypothetical protein